MSHCHYSLTYGKETEVHYDLPALERHFLSRFVYGKPFFGLSTACVLDQCKNIHNSENFAAIRRNVHPQVGSCVNIECINTALSFCMMGIGFKASIS